MSGNFANDSSQVELLPGSLESEFTPQQIANFKQAFGVFDVNRDGRISTQEIFEVLTTMGNEVSAERQAKIKQAVIAVDVDRSGDLDFAEFIQFMKIMDEHNKSEATQKQVQQEKEQLDLRASWKYFSLININIKMHPAQAGACSVWQVLVAIACVYSLAHAIFIGIIIAFGWNPAIHQNPGTDTNERNYPDSNYYAPYILYARYANYANAVLVVLLLTDERKIHAVYEVLKDHGYKRSLFNLLKYVLRPIFVLNAAISIVYIGGIIGFKGTTDSIADNWTSIAPPAAVIIIAYLSMSYFLYFETFVVPSNACNYLKVLLADLFVFNWIRFIFMLLKNIVAILLLPAVLFLTIAMLFGCCLCPHFFDINAAESKTLKFLKLVAWFLG